MTNGVHNPHLYDGPNFANLQWCLTGTQNHPWHLLRIGTQKTDLSMEYTDLITGTFGSATEQCAPDKTAQNFTGWLISSEYTTIKIECTWSPMNSNSGDQVNTLSGTITRQPPEWPGGPTGWVLQGSVVVTVNGAIQPGQGPGNVKGTLYIEGREDVVAHAAP
jgi:hypothetical protein